MKAIFSNMPFVKDTQSTQVASNASHGSFNHLQPEGATSKTGSGENDHIISFSHQPEIQMETAESFVQMEPKKNEDEEVPIFGEDHIEIEDGVCEDRLSIDDERAIVKGDLVIVERDDKPNVLAEFYDKKGAQAYMNEFVPKKVAHRYLCLPEPGRTGTYAIYKHKDYTEDWKSK